MTFLLVVGGLATVFLAVALTCDVVRAQMRRRRTYPDTSRGTRRG